MFVANVSRAFLTALEMPIRVPVNKGALGYLEARGVDLRVFERMTYAEGATRETVAAGIVDYIKENGVEGTKGFTLTVEYGGETFDVRC